MSSNDESSDGGVIEWVHPERETNYSKTAFYREDNTFFENVDSVSEICWFRTSGKHEEASFDVNWKIEVHFRGFQIDGNETVPLISRIEVGTEDSLENCVAHIRLNIDEDYRLEGYVDSDSRCIEKKFQVQRGVSKDSIFQVEIVVIHPNVGLKHYLDGVNHMLGNYQNIIEFDDVWLVVNGEVIPANLKVLSLQSPVLKTMFETEMIEKESKRVYVPDVEPRIFKHLLHFMYYGKFESVDRDDWLKIMMAANKYLVENLVAICEERLMDILDVDNVVGIFHAADRVRAGRLKDSSMDFIVEHKHEVAGREDFKRLVRSEPDLFIELFCHE